MTSFPIVTNLKDCSEKVSAWSCGVAAHTRIWCAEGAATLSDMLNTNTHNVDTIMMASTMSNDAKIYMGNMLMQSMSEAESLLNLMPLELKINPNGLKIMSVIIKNFMKKDSKFIASLRREFVGCQGPLQPTDNKSLLKAKYTAWSSARDTLKNLGDVQSDHVCKDSLTLLLSKYDEISGDNGIIKVSEIMLSVEISLTKMCEITEKFANDWVSFETIKAKNKVPNKPIIPVKKPIVPVQNNKNVNASTTINTPAEHCEYWVNYGYCSRKETCSKKHEESMKGKKDPVILAHYATVKCRKGKDCKHHSDGVCMYNHDGS